MRTLLPTHLQTLSGALLICLLAPGAGALAQDKPSKHTVAPAPENPPKAAAAPPDNPLSAHNKMIYGGVKAILLRSAEKMPEENYGFKPTDTVRSFGQVVGHVADAQYIFCSIVRGETNPALKIEQTKTSKADLVAALKDAFAYCDKAYDSMTDASAVQMVNLHGGDTPKMGALATNNVHTIEHYGNLITYLRMKNIVPPTSEPEFMQQMRKK
ncbi:MAG: DinB family protein [Thermoanaerobaculia bacterium]|nr:DinB family protein [Thermoanaerobaculia bacterium]